MKTTSSALLYLCIFKFCLLFFLSNHLLGQEKHLNQMVSEAPKKLEIQAIKSQVLDFDKDTLFNRIKAEKGKGLEYEGSAKKVDTKLNPKGVKFDNELSSANDPFDEVKNKKEDISRRDAFSKHFINEDGSYTALIGAGPIHYLKDGNWEDINGKIEKYTAGDHAYRNTTNLLESWYGSTSRFGVKTVLKEGEVKEFLNIKMYWEKAGNKVEEVPMRDVASRVSDEKLYYDNLFGEISAEFTTMTGGRKLNYIIPDRDALGIVPQDAEYLVFSEDIVLPAGWKYEVIDKGIDKGNLFVYDLSGNAVMKYSKPEVMENYLQAPIVPPGDYISFEVKKISSGLTYIMKVKTSWLLDNSRIFPLAVDPTVYAYPNNNNYWSGVVLSNGNGSDGSDGILNVGLVANTEYDAYVRFNTSSIPVGSIVTAAQSGLYYYARNGQMNSRTMTALNTVDPLDTATWYEIYDNYLTAISSASASIGTTAGYKTNTFTPAGLEYVQAGLQHGWTSVLLYPSGNSWQNNNYAAFYSHTNTINPPRLSITYTAAAAGYCVPVSQFPSGLYINQVELGGVYANPKNQTSTYDADGYTSYVTGALPTQAQGEGVNIRAYSTGDLLSRGTWKAWVDWNQNNVFEESETVYNITGFAGSSVTFGFVIPDNQTPGNYRLRIRVNNGLNVNMGNGYYENFGYDFGSCDNITFNSAAIPDGIYDYYFGETEDYAFTVIANCASKITEISDGEYCGEGTVELGATATNDVTEFRWYSDMAMTNLVGTSLPDALHSTLWTTPSISISTTYYVAAYNGSCESLFGTPVTAIIKQLPEISFTPTTAEICGDKSSVQLTTAGSNEQVYLIKEDFEEGDLGVFTNIDLDSNGNAVDYYTEFQNRTSVYNPLSNVWYPAISSGFGENHFALAYSDAPSPNNPANPVQNALTLINGVNTVDITNLTLKLNLFYSRYYPTGTYPADEYVAIEASNDDFTNVTTIATFTANQGSASEFNTFTYNIPALQGLNNLKIRVRHYSSASNLGWLPDGVAVDNLELFGDKVLAPSYEFTSTPTISVFLDPDGLIPYNGEQVSTVYIKPDVNQLESSANWEVHATSHLSNGCDATGIIMIQNDSKVWNTGASDWASLNWKPGTAVPTADNCVIVRTPVFVPDLTDGLAKNLKVESGGSLTIQSGASLTVTDFITNEGAADDFVVESDANLLQINAGAINTGDITVRRGATVPSNQYNFWASPVADQLLYSIYPNIPNNRIMTYNTVDDYYTILPTYSNPTSDFGIGYSVKGPTSNSPNNSGGGTGVVAEFVGVPQNESLTATENRIAVETYDNDGNYNLIGNPFPSNLDLVEMYDQGNALGTGNASKFETATAYFWDNAGNTEMTQQGSSYNQSNFAYYHMNSGMGNAAPCGPPTCTSASGKKPNGIVKPGQGFIVNIAQHETFLTVNNAMRTIETLRGEDEAVYYKNGKMPPANDTHIRNDKFWLEMVNQVGLRIQTSVGYFEQAENTFDRFDAEILSESVSDNIYTLSKDGVKLAINGREGIFSDEDVIPLGIKFFANGKYRIQLEDRKGIFVQYQKIYIKDKYLDIVHNLTEEGPYEIDGIAGEYNDRFEIVFKPGDIGIGTSADTTHKIAIQKIDKQIQITSTGEPLSEVEIFNLSGWSVYKTTGINAKEFKIPVKSFDHQIIVVKVRTETGEIVTKKLVN